MRHTFDILSENQLSSLQNH